MQYFQSAFLLFAFHIYPIKSFLFVCLLTFIAKSGLVLGEALEPDPLADEVEELVEGRAALLVVVHLLLGLLALAAVHQTNLTK